VTHAHHRRGVDADHISAPVNQLHQMPHRRRYATTPLTRAVLTLYENPLMAEQQPRRPQSRGDQLFEAKRRGAMPPRELGHEGHARRLHAALHIAGFGGFDLQRRCAVNRLARLAGGENGEWTVPFRREDQHRVDILSGGQHAVAVDRGSAELARHLLRPLRNFSTNRAYFEPVGKGS